MVKIYLDFVTSGHGLKEIDEPEGFDRVSFGLEQGENRLGRDIPSVIGFGNQQMRLSSLPNHCLDIALYNFKTYGYEAVIKFLVEFDAEPVIIGDVSVFASDGATYIDFIVVEQSAHSMLKKRTAVKTDLFSKLTLDDDEIQPVTQHKVLLKAKPIIQVSEWSNPTIGKEISSNSFDGVYFNPIKQMRQWDVKYTLDWLLDFDADSSDNFRHIKAETNLNSITIKMNLDVVWDYIPQISSGGQTDYGFMGVRALWGQSIEEAIANETNHYLWQHKLYGDNEQQMILPAHLEYTIPFLNATDLLWISFTFASSNAAVNKATFKDCETQITATSVALNTVVPMVRLFDAMTYNARSSADLPISAPRWKFGGEFYNQFITTQPLMRNLRKPFLISHKDIAEDYLPEVKGDYQIMNDGTVFYDLYNDFYRNIEIASFTQREQTDDFGQPLGQIEGFEIEYNDRYQINEFRYKYRNFASQKENEQANTYDLVHGETEWLLNHNKNAFNIREIEVGWVRDAFMAELARRKAYDLSDTTATQDDDKIYIFDVVTLPAGTSFTETRSLKQEFNPELETLALINDNTFSWELLGIALESTFQIVGGSNLGTYIVKSITPSVLTLYATTAGEQVGYITRFKYFIDPAIVFTNRTSEGFSTIQNIEDGNNYSNLRFTTKRNILSYYSNDIATCYYFRQGKDVKNTVYKNNPDAITQLTGETVSIKEGESFIPSNILLTPYIYRIRAVMTLTKYLHIQETLRSIDATGVPKSGYITTYDADGLRLKGYVQKATWLIKESSLENDAVGEVEFTLEEKYQPFLLEILSVDTGGIYLTTNETGASAFSHSMLDKKLYLYNEIGMQIFPPVPYDRVKVNNSQKATSENELTQWLNLIQ